ncbi:hypothetical protein AB0F43_28620 [Kribbella sp. NPDC023972]|uniref:hypothetical protein n=1 Tax=Kribbella sp. NPDC023972 TaxID=3154795 RepID=UPI0033FA7590
MTEPSSTPQQPAPPAARSDPPESDGESPLRAVLSVVTTLGPPLTIATALMFYFGWARSETQAAEMGLDVSLFGYSTQDYALHSISTLYLPLLSIAALALAGLALHRRIGSALRRTESRSVLRRAGRLAFIAGLVTVGLALVFGSAELFAPLAIAGGTVVAAYGASLRSATSASAETSAQPSWHRALRLLLVGGVVTSALFWAVSDYATIVGRGYAAQVERKVPELPRVTAFSSSPLGLDAGGVTETPVTEGGKVLHYRTTGLRLLISSGGRMFFVHDGWKVGEGTVIVLPDSDQIRWQFSR